MTIAGQWAWKPHDATKSRTECLQTLLRIVGGDGNLLFNVGPMSDGRIEPEQVERLKEMGAWLAQFGEGVYGTRGGPFKPGGWGASTCKGDQIYLYVMQWPAEGPLRLPALPCKIVASELLTGGTLQLEQTEQGLVVDVPASARPDVATVIRLRVDTEAFQLPPVNVGWSRSLSFQAVSAASNVFQGIVESYGPGMALDDDTNTRWATDGGTHQAWLDIDLGRPTRIFRVMIDEALESRIRRFELQAKVGPEWQTIFAGDTVGRNFTRTFPPLTTQYVRLNILDASEGPTVWELQLF